MLRKTFTEIQQSDKRFKKLTLTIADSDHSDAHINGTEVIISKKYKNYPKEILQYLISHELGHYCSKHHILFNFIVFWTIPIFAAIAGLISIAITPLTIQQATAQTIIPWFITCIIYFTIKEGTLLLEYQADAAGFKILEKVSPGVYKKGMSSIYSRRIVEAREEKEKDRIRKRAEKKLNRLPWK